MRLAENTPTTPSWFRRSRSFRAFLCLLALLPPSCHSAEEATKPAATWQAEDVTPTPPSTADPTPISSDVAAAGIHNVKNGTALAFETGMSLLDASRVIEKAVADGLVTASEARVQTRPLGQTQVRVTIHELQPTHKSTVRSIRLTFFANVLVAVMTLYEPDTKRALEWAREYGQGVHADGWIGWWLRDERIVVQASPDGTILEVMNLEAASRVVPDIESHTLDSWRRRYKVPPPWGAELLPPAP